MNVADRVQGTRGVHGPSHEGALEKHDDPKMDPVLQAAQTSAERGQQSLGCGGTELPSLYLELIGLDFIQGTVQQGKGALMSSFYQVRPSKIPSTLYIWSPSPSDCVHVALP